MITDNYIKMCEKAEEIQVKWKPRIGDKIKHRLGKSIQLITLYDIETYSDDFYIEEKYTWLPTQEQLQKMISRNWYDVFCKFLWWHSDDDKSSEEFESMFTSMNEVWLAFVMKEKYNKVWNGKEWVNVSK